MRVDLVPLAAAKAFLRRLELLSVLPGLGRASALLVQLPAQARFVHEGVEHVRQLHLVLVGVDPTEDGLRIDLALLLRSDLPNRGVVRGPAWQRDIIAKHGHDQARLQILARSQLLPHVLMRLLEQGRVSVSLQVLKPAKIVARELFTDASVLVVDHLLVLFILYALVAILLELSVVRDLGGVFLLPWDVVVTVAVDELLVESRLTQVRLLLLSDVEPILARPEEVLELGTSIHHSWRPLLLLVL